MSRSRSVERCGISNQCHDDVQEDNHGGVAAKHSRKNNKKSVLEKTSPFGLLKVVKDFSENVNARIYGAVNFLQCFDCTFQKNFFPFFLTYFARGRMSSKILSLIITSSFVLPWVATSLYTKLWRLEVCSEHFVPCST